MRRSEKGREALATVDGGSVGAWAVCVCVWEFKKHKRISKAVKVRVRVCGAVHGSRRGGGRPAWASRHDMAPRPRRSRELEDFAARSPQQLQYNILHLASYDLNTNEYEYRKCMRKKCSAACVLCVSYGRRALCCCAGWLVAGRCVLACRRACVRVRHLRCMPPRYCGCGRGFGDWWRGALAAGSTLDAVRYWWCFESCARPAFHVRACGGASQS